MIKHILNILEIMRAKWGKDFKFSGHIERKKELENYDFEWNEGW